MFGFSCWGFAAELVGSGEVRGGDYVVDRFDPSGDELLDEYVASHPDVELEYARQTAVIPASVYSVRDGGCDFLLKLKKPCVGQFWRIITLSGDEVRGLVCH